MVTGVSLGSASAGLGSAARSKSLGPCFESRQAHFAEHDSRSALLQARETRVIGGSCAEPIKD